MPVNEHKKEVKYNEYFSSVECNAITHLQSIDSPVPPPRMRVCKRGDSPAVIVSDLGVVFDTFLKYNVKSSKDAAACMAAACSVLQKLHEHDMLHLEAKPDNFVVMDATEGSHPGAVTFTLESKPEQLYSVHVVDYETAWRRIPPANVKNAFNDIVDTLSKFNYQSHDFYALNFASGVKFDMHALLIGTWHMLFTHELHCTPTFEAVANECVRLANQDGNPEHAPMSIYSDVDDKTFYYFLFEFAANVATPAEAAQCFAALV